MKNIQWIFLLCIWEGPGWATSPWEHDVGMYLKPVQKVVKLHSAEQPFQGQLTGTCLSKTFSIFSAFDMQMFVTNLGT